MTNRNNFQLPNLGAGTTRAQTATGRRLEETKLSRHKTFSSGGASGPTSGACSVCGGRLESDDDFQQSTKICGDCLGRFAQVGAALDAHADQKARAAKLERWARGVNY